MARRGNIFFFVSDILQLINTPYCSSAMLSIIVHLVARGHFLKTESWKRGRKRAVLFLSTKNDSHSLIKLPASQGSRGLWRPLNRAGTGVSGHGGQRVASAGPARLFLPPKQWLPDPMMLRTVWAVFVEMAIPRPPTPSPRITSSARGLRPQRG